MKLSIIIPTYNEAHNIPELVDHLLVHGGNLVHEVLIVDGGSKDDTIALARKHGAQAFVSPNKGRPEQMNYAASRATGTHLYFVHADTRPPKGYAQDLLEAVEGGHKAGCFRQLWDTKNKFLLCCSWFTQFRGLIFRGGGQTLMAEKELFDKVGGYREAMIMEEYDLIAKMVKYTKFAIIKRAPVMVSPRDYQEHGVWRLHWVYIRIFGMYFTGMSQDKMKAFLRKKIQ